MYVLFSLYIPASLTLYHISNMLKADSIMNGTTS